MTAEEGVIAAIEQASPEARKVLLSMDSAQLYKLITILLDVLHGELTAEEGVKRARDSGLC